jgi:hypothetical protein
MVPTLITNQKVIRLVLFSSSNMFEWFRLHAIGHRKDVPKELQDHWHHEAAEPGS